MSTTVASCVYLFSDLLTIVRYLSDSKKYQLYGPGSVMFDTTFAYFHYFLYRQSINALGKSKIKRD